VKLRDYQKQDYKQLKSELKQYDHVLFGAATGYGKSAIYIS
jgi:superfamily II DNA or RNA helicase